MLVRKYDERKDIAFLEYKGAYKNNYYSIASNYYTGDECYSIGNFSNYGLSLKKGHISLRAINLEYNEVVQEFIQCAINIGPGDSGAPLFNNRNKVIGMIAFRAKGLNGTIEQGFAYVIPILEIVKIYKTIT